MSFLVGFGVGAALSGIFFYNYGKRREWTMGKLWGLVDKARGK